MGKRAKPQPPASPVDQVRKLAALLNEYGLTSIEASWGGARIRIRRDPAPGAPPLRAAVRESPAAIVPAAKAEAAEPLAAHISIEAPMVGTFYRAPSPGTDPFVREGDMIKEEQVLCIIEAMKLMNEIEAKHAGRIVKILVENGQAVEYGQPLFMLDPLR